MSFCFVPEEVEISDDGKTHEVIRCSLHDTALVVKPAYEGTSVSLRSKSVSLDHYRRRLMLCDRFSVKRA